MKSGLESVSAYFPQYQGWRLFLRDLSGGEGDGPAATRTHGWGSRVARAASPGSGAPGLARRPQTSYLASAAPATRGYRPARWAGLPAVVDRTSLRKVHISYSYFELQSVAF
jgi:hypothetical protein